MPGARSDVARGACRVEAWWRNVHTRVRSSRFSSVRLSARVFRGAARARSATAAGTAVGGLAHRGGSCALVSPSSATPPRRAAPPAAMESPARANAPGAETHALRAACAGRGYLRLKPGSLPMSEAPRPVSALLTPPAPALSPQVTARRERAPCPVGDSAPRRAAPRPHPSSLPHETLSRPGARIYSTRLNRAAHPSARRAAWHAEQRVHGGLSARCGPGGRGRFSAAPSFREADAELSAGLFFTAASEPERSPMPRPHITFNDAVNRITHYASAGGEHANDGDERPQHYFVHVSSYPNQSPAFYAGVWRYLNRPENTLVGTDLAYKHIRNDKWLYVVKHTQDYFSKVPMTRAEAQAECSDIHAHLMWFAQVKLELNGEDSKPPKARVNVIMSQAVPILQPRTDDELEKKETLEDDDRGACTEDEVETDSSEEEEGDDTKQSPLFSFNGDTALDIALKLAGARLGDASPESLARRLDDALEDAQVSQLDQLTEDTAVGVTDEPESSNEDVDYPDSQ